MFIYRGKILDLRQHPAAPGKGKRIVGKWRDWFDREPPKVLEDIFLGLKIEKKALPIDNPPESVSKIVDDSELTIPPQVSDDISTPSRLSSRGRGRGRGRKRTPQGSRKRSPPNLPPPPRPSPPPERISPEVREPSERKRSPKRRWEPTMDENERNPRPRPRYTDRERSPHPSEIGKSLF